MHEDMLGIQAECIGSDPLSQGNEFYIMDPDPLLSEYGHFLTYNAFNGITGNDSDHDYNGTDGRIVWHFDPMCIPDIMVRHIMLEFLEIGGESCSSCPDLGDMNGDGGFNVLDIVTLANCVLDENCETLEFGCAADINGDTYYNVLDIVTLANCVLNEDCGGRVDDASYSKLIISDNIVLIEADGFIGGVQMTLQHGDDFTIEMTDRALFADYLTSGNETRLLVITPETDKLFSFSGDFEITEIIVANSQYEVSVDLPLATSYSLSEAYPNPFNPTTTMTLTMPVSGDIRVEVYNLLGQVVSTLASGYMEGGTYTLTWDASDVSSGMYFVKMVAGKYVKTQKLMLVK